MYKKECQKGDAEPGITLEERQRVPSHTQPQPRSHAQTKLLWAVLQREGKGQGGEHGHEGSEQHWAHLQCTSHLA
eukprot:1159122-Pelagomonas_calceolata.AAC.16